MAIIFDKVSFKYNKNDKKNTINNISFELCDNKIYGIIGKSGSGKTTLLELIDGLIIQDKGKILINDKEVSKDKSIRSDIGFAFQFPEQQFFEKKVKNEIEFSAKNYNIKKDKTKEVLKLVGLNNEILSKKISELSFGEKRMVAIASILIYNPNIILLDEPTIGLDYNNKKRVISLIKKLKNRLDKTIIIVSHDIDLLYEITDKLLIIDNGKLISYKDTQETYKDWDLISKYNLSVPRVVEFEYIAKKEKNIKLMKSRTTNDLIKEVYRNV